MESDGEGKVEFGAAGCLTLTCIRQRGVGDSETG